MAKTICIMGESGSGKTTALRNLNPETTLYIDSDGKGLSWRGWRSQYSADKGNYAVDWNKNNVLKALMYAENAGKFETVVIDTINAIMIADERARKDDKGYDKWADLAWSVYDIVKYAQGMANVGFVVFLAHTATERNDSGFEFTHVLTSGKKLDKIVLESMMFAVLHAKRVEGEYRLYLQEDTSTAKSGMIDESATEYIANDAARYLDLVRAYESGD